MKISLKILSLILAVVLLAGMITACGNTRNAQSGNSTEAAGTTSQSDGSSQASQSTASKYPLTLQDAKGTSVTIAAKPVKIVSMPLGACEMLMSLVDKSRIAAMTFYVDDVNVSNVAEAAKGVGQRFESNAEKIIALQPDLVLMDTWTKDDLVKQLRDAKIPVFILSAPTNVDQEKEVLRILGKITDEDAKAQETVNWMDQKLKEVSDKLAGLQEDKKLSILDYSEMGSTSGKGTNFDDIVTRAGLINPVSKEGLEGWPQLSKEMVVKYNPDIILLPSWYYDTKVNFQSLSDSIKGDKALAGVKAVQNNKLISLPHKHMTTTSQYSVLAVEDVAKAAYPELFK